MKNWKTNLGGALAVTGSALVGVGLLPQLGQLSSNSPALTPEQLSTLWYVTLAGIIMSAFGKGITSLFAADSKVVNEIAKQTDAIATQTNVNTVQIADTKQTVENQLNT